jgi:hypothetical protein
MAGAHCLSLDPCHGIVRVEFPVFERALTGLG